MYLLIKPLIIVITYCEYDMEKDNIRYATLEVLRARINGNEMAEINGTEGGQKEARAGLWG